MVYMICGVVEYESNNIVFATDKAHVFLDKVAEVSASDIENDTIYDEYVVQLWDGELIASLSLEKYVETVREIGKFNEQCLMTILAL